jgi:hypothetical protein
MSQGHGSKLESKREDAIVALLSSRSICAAAKKIEVDESTLRRWLKDPGFSAELAESRRQMAGIGIAAIQGSMQAAVATLRRNLKCGHAGTECRAAAALLQHGIGSLQLLDMAERLAALEAILKQREDQ